AVKKAVPAKATGRVTRAEAAPKLTAERVYDMDPAEARREAKKIFPDLSPRASQAEIVDRLTPDRPVTHADDETPEVAHLRQLVEGGKLGEGKLIRQGSSARVTRYTTPGGTRVVEKRSIAVPGSADNPTLDALTPGDDARDRVDAEVLTSRLGRKL